jgi:S-DNA-T family DNA segregation ATPase FtsK/SpoIIIE
MRKEIIGIFLFFLVIFTLISLLSYHHADPSIHNVGAAGPVHNLFGKVGALVSGVLIGLFGLGAFWTPILLLLASVCFFSSGSQKAIYPIAGGGLLLLLTTGSLLAFKQDYYVLLGSKMSAGGIIGLPLKIFLVRYANHAGAAIILGLAWLIGFILTTGFSLVAFFRHLHGSFFSIMDRFKTAVIKIRERRQKAKKRKRRIKATAQKPKAAIKIKAPAAPPKPKAKPAPR